MVRIQNNNSTKCWWGWRAWRATGILICCQDKCKMVEPFWKTVWHVLTVLNRHTIVSNNYIPRYLPKWIENMSTWNSTHVFIIALFITVRDRKQLKCLSKSEWINKLWLIHSMKNYSVIKRNELLSHEAKNIKLYIVKWKKPIWKSCILYEFNYVINKKKRGKTMEKVERLDVWSLKVEVEMVEIWIGRAQNIF